MLFTHQEVCIGKKTVLEVMIRPRVVLKTEGTAFPNTG